MRQVIVTIAGGGPEGPEGPEGKEGAQGPEGKEGPKGSKGLKGEKGTTGATGPTGPAGVASVTILTHSGSFKPSEESLASAPEPDRITFTLTKAGLVNVYYFGEVNQTKLALYLDGVLVENEEGSPLERTASDDPGKMHAWIGTEGGKGVITWEGAIGENPAGMGVPFTLLLAPGEHKLEIKYKGEGENTKVDTRTLAITIAETP